MIRAFAISLLTQQLLRIKEGARGSSPRTALIAQARKWVQKKQGVPTPQTAATPVGLVVAQAAIPLGQVLTEHLANLVQKRLSRLSETRHFEAAKDPADAIHDLRVASRRLRAFVDVFDPLIDAELGHRARKPLRSITRAARAARDADVQLGLLQAQHAAATSDIERAVLEELLIQTEEQRKTELRRLRKRLKRLNWKDIDSAMAAVLGTAVTNILSDAQAMTQLTWKLLEPLATQNPLEFEQTGDQEPTTQLHEYRIHLKRLRYALELFEPALGSGFDTLYAPIETLQDLLGKYHDLVVLGECMVRQRKRLERGRRVTLAHASSGLEHKLLEQRRAALVQYREYSFDLLGWQRALKAQLRELPQ